MRYNEFGDECISKSYDYEPDIDDLDTVEDLFMNHNEQEKYTAYYNAIENIDYTLEDFNRFCDMHNGVHF